MKFDIGDLVTRKSYNHDLVFIVTDIIDDIYYLKGSNIRLCADSPEEDLEKYEDDKIDKEEEMFMERIKPSNDLDRTDYFYRNTWYNSINSNTKFSRYKTAFTGIC